MLDMGSQIFLVTEEVAAELALDGPLQDLHLSTVNGIQTRPSRRVSFSVCGPSRQERVLHNVFTTPRLCVTGHAVNWPKEKLKWSHLANISLADVPTGRVDILLGADNFDMIVPREVREGPQGSPAAVRTMLGWVATDRMPGALGTSTTHVNHISVPTDDLLHQQLEQFWSTESFGTRFDDEPKGSKEDRRAMKALETSIKLVNGRYQTDLLWKRSETTLPNNRPAAERRLQHIERKLRKDPEFAILYTETIESYIKDGLARKVDEQEEASEWQWLLPHHGVQNPNKPGKVRVVFDAAASYKGTCLNDHLLTGPDLSNSLVGVLFRFRQRQVPFSADIRAMYHSVGVTPAHQPALRFLWRGADENAKLTTYQMQVHVFGAASSSCSVNFALHKCAEDNKDEFPTAARAVRSRFYVDDYLDSVDSVQEAQQLRQSLCTLLKRGGFDLTKWVSPHRELGAPSTRSLDLDDAPIERALGVLWDTKDDSFTFHVKILNKPATKRGMLSQASSVFDPLGFITPFTVRAKCMLQRLWAQDVGWDDIIQDQELLLEWQTWLRELEELRSFRVRRCYRPPSAEPISYQLHVFADASLSGRLWRGCLPSADPLRRWHLLCLCHLQDKSCST